MPAHELGHPVYDCLYLALAEREQALVVTADRVFAARVGGGLSHPLLKFSGGSGDDYATIPDDSSSPS